MTEIITESDRMLLELEKRGVAHNRGVASEGGLDAYLQLAHVELPLWLKRWLLHINGIALLHAELYSVGPGGITKNAVLLYDKSEMGYRGRGLFPVGGDIAGNDYVIELSGGSMSGSGPVLFADGAEGWEPVFVVASSFERFIWFVLNRHLASGEPWVFDKEYALKHDPKLSVQKYTLPWDA